MEQFQSITTYYEAKVANSKQLRTLIKGINKHDTMLIMYLKIVFAAFTWTLQLTIIFFC